MLVVLLLHFIVKDHAYSRIKTFNVSIKIRAYVNFGIGVSTEGESVVFCGIAVVCFESLVGYKNAVRLTPYNFSVRCF